jgi:type I restriction enzyme, S subunit
MRTAPIGRLFRIIGGKPAPKGEYAFSEHGTPFVKMKDLGKAHFSNNLVDIEQKVSDEVAIKNGLNLIKQGSILLPRSGSVALNHRAVLGVDAYMVSHICALEVIDDSEINNLYAYYYLRSIKMDRISKKTTGLDAITFEDLGKVKIPLPLIDHQIRIAHLLGKVEGLIAQRKQHMQQLDDLLKSIFLEMFGDPVRNDKGWDIKKLGDVAFIERGRFSPRPRNDPKFYGGAHPFIQTGDISRSNGRLRNYTQTLNDLGARVSKEFPVGTIVIAIVGATIGETAILEIATYAPDSVIGITPKSQDLAGGAVFWEYILRFWKPVLRANAPDAARANINIETLRPLPIIFPDEDSRSKFSTIATKVNNLSSVFQQSLAGLESLYGALSQKAFKGELDLSRVPLPVQEANGIHEQLEKVLTPIISTTERPKAIELPDPVDLQSLNTTQGREALIGQWLDAYFWQLASNEAFSVAEFLEAAQLRMDTLTKGEVPDLGMSAYEQLKRWVFHALENGRLSQTYDDDGNRVQLSSAKA